MNLMSNSFKYDKWQGYKKRLKRTMDNYKGELDNQDIPPSKKTFLENQIEFMDVDTVDSYENIKKVLETYNTFKNQSLYNFEWFQFINSNKVNM